MKRKLCIVFFLCFPLLLMGQQFNYSLIDFTSQRINPATTGLYNQWYVSAVHREQNSGADFKIRSTALSAAYPQLFPRRGNVRGAFGIDMLNDVSGINNSFKVREVGLSYALRIVDEELQSFNLGTSLFYQSRGFDYDQITTNAQYVTGRGFDLNIANGENLIDFQQSFYRLNAGLYWQKSTLRRQKAGHFGVSAFDLNKAKDSFYSRETTFDPTYFLTFGFMAFADRDWHVYPNALLVSQAGKVLYNAGVETTYTIDRHQSISFKPRYLISRELVAAFEYEKDNLVFGASYDVPINGGNSANQGTFEFGLRIVGEVQSISKKRRRKGKKGKIGIYQKPLEQIPIWSIKPINRLVELPSFSSENMKKSLHRGVPSGFAELETEYTFNYATNQAYMVPAVIERLKEIVESVVGQQKFLIYLEGHTDSTGAADYNQQLSIERANYVAKFLNGLGVELEKIKIIGYGEKLPIASNDTPYGRAMNRRVELKLIKLN